MIPSVEYDLEVSLVRRGAIAATLIWAPLAFAAYLWGRRR